jgi:outer membrane protein
MLPRIMFAENYTRGNDPVFVFGAKLRQQVFSAQDLELNSLNRPTPFGNYASRFSGQWKLFDSTQSWKALDRAKFMNVAAEQQLNRTDQELVFQTVQAFYGVLLAKKQVEVAEDAVKTVEAIEQQSRARVESGKTRSSRRTTSCIRTSIAFLKEFRSRLSKCDQSTMCRSLPLLRVADSFR